MLIQADGEGLVSPANIRRGQVKHDEKVRTSCSMGILVLCGGAVRLYLLCKVWSDAVGRKALGESFCDSLSLLVFFSCRDIGIVVCNEMVRIENRREELNKLYL